MILPSSLQMRLYVHLKGKKAAYGNTSSGAHRHTNLLQASKKLWFLISVLLYFMEMSCILYVLHMENF